MSQRKEIIRAILYNSKKEYSKKELIELSEMTHKELVNKLINISYSLKFPLN